MFPPSNDLAVKGVDDGVGLAEEAVYSANLLEIIFPLGGMLDDNPEIDVLVFGLDPPRYFLALATPTCTYAVSMLSAEPAIM